MRLLKGGTPIQPVHITAPKPNPIEQAYAQKQLGLNDGQTVQMPSAQRMLASQLVGGAHDVMQSFNPVEWGKQSAEQTNEGVGNWKFGNKTDALKNFGGAALATGGLIGMPEGGMLEEGLVPKYREMAKAFTAANDAKLAQWGQGNAIPMWHSSPVRDIDRFTLSKIGTGQGAATFGPGLYSAESPLISGPGGKYDVEMTNKAIRRANVPLSRPWEDEDMAELLTNLRDKNRDLSNDDLAEMFAQRAQGRAQRRGYGNSPLKRDAGTMLSDIQKIDQNKGGVYRNEIQASPEQFLHGDLPFADQPPIVQSALRSLVERRPQNPSNKMYRQMQSIAEGEFADPDTKGTDFLDSVLQLLKWDVPSAKMIPIASNERAFMLPDKGQSNALRGIKALRQRGVVGNLYRDAESRYLPDAVHRNMLRLEEAQQQLQSPNEYDRMLGRHDISYREPRFKEMLSKPVTYNSVIFSPSRIKILEKLGLLGLVGGASQIPQLPNNQP